ncbi:MAG TPA: hypothetical protein VFA25_11790 [Actinomycetota bacterium]|jgi:hypothetical protein|nr:hypothetical protein [Actinomycetota bacterium]
MYGKGTAVGAGVVGGLAFTGSHVLFDAAVAACLFVAGLAMFRVGKRLGSLEKV